MHRVLLATAVLLAFASNSGAGGDLQDIVSRFDHEDFAQREAATEALAAAADAQLSEVLALFRSAEASPEFRNRMPAVLRKIFERQCLGVGEPETGATFQLYFETDGESFTAVHPVVATLADGSSGASSGLRVGDVVLSWDGKPIEGASSVIELRRLVRQAGEGAEVKLAVLRFNKRSGVELLGKEKRMELSLTLGPPVTEPTRKERRNQYAGWLDRMRHEHDLPKELAHPQS